MCRQELREVYDSSLNVMDSATLSCDVHAHLMLKWPIHRPIVFQSCEGKAQNTAVCGITIPLAVAQSLLSPWTKWLLLMFLRFPVLSLSSLLLDSTGERIGGYKIVHFDFTINKHILGLCTYPASFDSKYSIAH